MNCLQSTENPKETTFFVPNSNFLISFLFRLFDLSEYVVRNIKGLRSTSGCKDLEIRKSEMVTKTEFLYRLRSILTFFDKLICDYTVVIIYINTIKKNFYFNSNKLLYIHIFFVFFQGIKALLIKIRLHCIDIIVDHCYHFKSSYVRIDIKSR